MSSSSPFRPGPSDASPGRPRLRFVHLGFRPREWERKRLHLYSSTGGPLWWRLWMRLRELGALFTPR